MEDNYNIKDLLIEDEGAQKSVGIKKILMAIAALVVLFLIVLIIMKFINSGDIDTSKPLVMPKAEDNSSFVVAPVAKPDIPKAPKTEVVEVKVIPTEPQKVPSLAIEPKSSESELAVEQKKVEIEQKPKEIKPVEVVSKHEEIKQNLISKAKQEPKIVKQEQPKTETKVAKSQKVEPQKVTPIQPKATKPEVVKPTSEPKHPTKAKKPSNDSVIASLEKIKPSPVSPNSNTYIQILSTSNFKDDDPQIKKLKSLGYGYTLHKTTVNGREVTKVLVGPYSGDTLEKEMKNIRENVSKDAFVFRK
ncbi:MAG: SPOR domain-containing protein [Campylobacter sp.]|nr:SPOR domain-containing protein [Campylobacter sp.]